MSHRLAVIGYGGMGSWHVENVREKIPSLEVKGIFDVRQEACDKAKENGFGVIICAAGMAAHLAGVIAGHTTLPVIGIPCKGANFDGMDALLATVQMPSGIPVATVAVDGAKNAAILAIQMLALSDEGLADKLEKAKQDMIDGVVAKDKALQDKLASL